MHFTQYWGFCALLLALSDGDVWSVLLAGEVIDHSEVAVFIFTGSVGDLNVEKEHHTGNGETHLHESHTLSNTATGPDGEGAEGSSGDVNGVLGRNPHSTVGLTHRTLNPTLWNVLGGLTVVVWVSVDGISWGSAVSSAREVDTVDFNAAWQNFTGDGSGYSGGETHGLVNTGLEVNHIVELGAGNNVLDISEVGADLLLELLEGVGVADEVEDGGSETGRGGVSSSNHKDVALTPEFRGSESLASFWVLCIEEVIEEVLLGFVAGHGSFFGTLSSFDSRVLDEVPSVVGKLVDEDLV